MAVKAEFEENEQWFNEYLKAVDEALTKAAIFVQNEARSLAPVDSGNLKESIDYEVEESKAIVKTDVEYAIFQEYGTKKMSSHPFMRPALFGNQSAIESIIARVMKGKL
jgi:HK97 gp10 family phage protein